MSEVVTIARNAVTAKLHNPSRDIKLAVQTVLSYKVDGAENTVAFRRRGWNGRSSFMDMRSCTFPAGFTALVTSYLTRLGHKVNIVRKPLPEPLNPPGGKVDAFPEDPRYYYQREVVEKVVQHGAIIAQIATGGGKSRIARLLYARLGRPTLFLTTRSLLMYQMKDSFEKDLGVECSVLGDGQFGHEVRDPKTGVVRQAIKRMTVGMVQTLAARVAEKTLQGEFEAVFDHITKTEANAVARMRRVLKKDGKSEAEIKAAVASLAKKQNDARPKPEAIKKEAQRRLDEHNALRAKTINLLSKFECVIMEEAHEASGNSYYDILRHCVNAHYRLALTATPFMKSDEEANMRLMASCGPIGAKVTEKQLIDCGILATPFFKTETLTTRPPKLYRGTSWQSAYRLGITDCEERNQLVVKNAIEAKKYGLSVMTLIQHTHHGETLKKMMLDAGLKVEFISGEDDHSTRKAALQALAAKKYDVLIGSTILDVGVDVPAVGMIIIAGGGKAETAYRQRIGRGLRAKKKGPNVAFIVDFEDIYNDHLKDHFKIRMSILMGTPGFAERVLPSRSEFPFVKLGFRML